MWIRLLQMEYGFKKKRFIMVYRLDEDVAFQRKVMICARNFIGVLALQGNYECIASGRQPHPLQGVHLGFCLTDTPFPRYVALTRLWGNSITT